MRFVTVFIRLALFALPVLASEELLPIKRAVLNNSYIVLLTDSANLGNVTGSIPGSNITNQWTIVKGFAAALTGQDLSALRGRADVASVSENAVAKTSVNQ